LVQARGKRNTQGLLWQRQMQLPFGRSTHVLWGVAKQLASLVLKQLLGNPGISGDGNSDVQIVSSPKFDLLQVVVVVAVNQHDHLDAASLSDHGYVESECFDSDDDLEVKSEPVMGKQRPSCLLSAPSVQSSNIRTRQNDKCVLSTTKVVSGPSIFTPTKFLLETLYGKELTLEDKIALLTCAAERIVAPTA